jgi:hypothetical protein
VVSQQQKKKRSDARAAASSLSRENGQGSMQMKRAWTSSLELLYILRVQPIVLDVGHGQRIEQVEDHKAGKPDALHLVGLYAGLTRYAAQ